MKQKWMALLLALALVLAGCQHQSPAPSGDGLSVTFLDVGQADCALLECDGEFLLIDGGNREDSQLLVSFLEQEGVQQLKALVCTHPHEDHVGGLPAVLAVYPTAQVYAPTSTYSSQFFDDFLYYTHQQGLEITIPKPGDTISLGQATLTVLGPVTTYAETNDTSLVLRAVYGETAFLFTGDMEKAAETDLLDSGAQVRSQVLKVGHHGSDTSTSIRFLSQVDPDYGVISCGRDNKYGHPHQEVLERLAQAQTTVLRTDQLGTIRAFSDGRDVTFHWDNQNQLPENPLPTEDTACIGNQNSKVFHSPQCKNLPAPENQVPFPSREAALQSGYRPCGSCKP